MKIKVLQKHNDRELKDVTVVYCARGGGQWWTEEDPPRQLSRHLCRAAQLVRDVTGCLRVSLVWRREEGHRGELFATKMPVELRSIEVLTSVLVDEIAAWLASDEFYDDAHYSDNGNVPDPTLIAAALRRRFGDKPC